jgi:hypothetical protein
MARTAIVNPRASNGRFTKRKRRSYGSKSKRRRRNPAAAGDRNYNPRRRSKRRRRRNPGSSVAAPASSVYSAGGYRRRNPEMFDYDRLSDHLPAATLGNWSARFAARLAGPLEVSTAGGPPVPGFKHAIAMAIGAHVGSQMVGSMLGAEKAPIAYAGALGFAGDLFARRRLFSDNKWVKENLLLEGVDDLEEATADWEGDDDLDGFENTSALGDGEQLVEHNGVLYRLSGVAPDPAQLPGGGMNGFQNESALGNCAPSQESSFGYVPR